MLHYHEKAIPFAGEYDVVRILSKKTLIVCILN